MAMIIASLRPLASVCGSSVPLALVSRTFSPRKKDPGLVLAGRTDGSCEPWLIGRPRRRRAAPRCRSARRSRRARAGRSVVAVGVGDALADLVAVEVLDDDADVGHRRRTRSPSSSGCVEARDPGSPVGRLLAAMRSASAEEPSTVATSSPSSIARPHAARRGASCCRCSPVMWTGYTTAPRPRDRQLRLRSRVGARRRHGWRARAALSSPTAAVAPATWMPTSSAGTSLKYWM